MIKEICAATNSECQRCQPGGCNNRVEQDHKPRVFSMARYREAVNELEELKRINKMLENQVISQRITIQSLESELDELREHTSTATGLIELVKSRMCKMCIKCKECYEALENGEKFYCDMDML